MRQWTVEIDVNTDGRTTAECDVVEVRVFRVGVMRFAPGDRDNNPKGRSDDTYALQLARSILGENEDIMWRDARRDVAVAATVPPGSSPTMVRHFRRQELPEGWTR